MSRRRGRAGNACQSSVTGAALQPFAGTPAKGRAESPTLEATFERVFDDQVEAVDVIAALGLVGTVADVGE